ncbi:hypothetical protein DFR70_12597 [Nocardia tenerifensis]|uniref:Uncharacterized protein n=1 Tax=Nocardia tenerifensis TaxID=228006 RepID=A0A318JMQ7_9NOCA|nr:hypothetical protein [Nocardia tenerifensis]PXX54116.1 hypothetical protein DFR70_12597 [Nocardia tenerifensis]
MEHGQETGESIGAMLSSIASVLREVSDKLDAVAARVDGVDRTESAPADHSVEARLAKLEAWAFRAGQDISGIDGRLEKVESGGGTPAHSAPDSERAERPLPRAASRRNSVAAPSRSVTVPTARESIGSPHEPASTTRENAIAGENAAAARESVSRRYEPSPSAATNARDSASHEANGVPQRGFGTPREPAYETPREPAYEPSPATSQSFTTPREPIATPREPISTPREPISTPREPTATPREPIPASSTNFTAPTPREPLPVRQSSFTAPREPATSSYENFTGSHENSYESMVASSDGGRKNGATTETNGTTLTGAHRAEEDLIPVDNTHVDKLQAMLDELKKTAAAPLGRSDVFGPPATDLTSTGYQPERSTDTPRDYRLSSPPPLS